MLGGFFLTEVDFNLKGREAVLNQPLFLNGKIKLQEQDILFKKWMQLGNTRCFMGIQRGIFTTAGHYRCYGRGGGGF